MGNRALRREAARLLKEKKVPFKLYRGKCNRYPSARNLKDIIRCLGIKDGDIVHDCDGHNHVVRNEAPCVYHQKGNYSGRIGLWTKSVSGDGYTTKPETQVIFSDGMRSCGCGTVYPPISRDEIEEYFLQSYRYYQVNPDGPWPPSAASMEMMATIAAGKHVHDEHGVLLPEWRAKITPWARNASEHIKDLA